MYRICIVVPIYKDFNSLIEEERISLIQLYKVLHKRNIYLIAPKSLDLKNYREQASKYNVTVKTKMFNNIYFKAIQGYNKLLLSNFFL